MPQLAKGGKWVFGWAQARDDETIMIPAEAFSEFHFQPNEAVVFLRGSRRSGGFAVGIKQRIIQTILSSRIEGEGLINDHGRIRVPGFAEVRKDQNLLVVRGSNFALSFLVKGPIVEEALRHTELEVFL